MATIYEIEKLPTTSQEAIREFDDRYIAAQGASKEPNWVETFGEVFPINAPMVSFVISQLAAKYEETRGESRTRMALEDDFDIKVVEHDDGYEAKLIDLYQNSFAVRRWNAAPTKFLQAEANLRALKIRTLIEAGTSTACWDGVNFFATNHPANKGNSALGTFSNYQSVAKSCLSVSDIEGEMTSMMAVLDEHGEKLGVEPDTILLPTEKFISCAHMLAQDQVTSGVSNTLKGKLNPVHCPQFTDANDWYLVDSKLIREVPPWIAARYVVPQSLGLRYFNEDSDFFKNTGKIKVSSHIWYGFALAFPHAIRKVVGS